MSEKYLLGVDVGTTGTKTILFTEDGRAVFEVYIVSSDYIYQAQLSYLTSLMSEFGMYNAYMENSFVVNELSQG